MFLKKTAKYLLRKFGMYNFLKYSRLFAYVEKRFKPEVILQKQKEVTFYKSFLSHCDLIFDIGANDGHKTEAFLHIAKKIVCCEPDAANFKILKTRFRKRKKQIFLENIAVGAHEGVDEMYVHHEASAFNTLNPKFKSVVEDDNLEKWNEKIIFKNAVQVKTASLDNLIIKYGQPDFIKIDVEGFELEVLKGLHTPVPYISIECLLPHFWEELQQSIGLIMQLEPTAIFNVAMNEQLIFDKFKSYTETITFLKTFKEHHFELVIKMRV